MVIETVIVPKSAQKILQRLTGQSRPDIALSLALKDLVRLRIDETRSHVSTFEKKYGMTFSEFEEAWKAGKIENPYSYPVEQDYMQWETALADLRLLEEILEWQA